MAYTAKQAINTFFQYLGIDENNVEKKNKKQKTAILYDDVFIIINPKESKIIREKMHGNIQSIIIENIFAWQ